MENNLSALGVNWQEIADQLVAFSSETIRRFASEQPTVISSFFAYAVDLPFFLLSFDTPDNALRVAQRTEQEAIAQRAKMLDAPTAWHGTRFSSTYPPILDYSYGTGYFAHESFAEIKIAALEDLEFAEDYPPREWGDDYAEGMTRIVLWRVIERLIASDVLGQLQLAAPFRVGYEMHDDTLTVLRILNWPHLP